jgi:uncharacterized membrane protein YgcG
MSAVADMLMEGRVSCCWLLVGGDSSRVLTDVAMRHHKPATSNQQQLRMRRFVFALILFLGIIAVRADARTIRWRDLAVRAELQDDGTLRVTETQAIVFSGDWNGGERTFRIEPHQTLTLHGVTRIDADGTKHALIDGDLGTIDNYQLVEGRKLRWRSRAPNDPEFDRTEIIYAIDYSLGGIVVPRVWPRDAYELRHDFAFPDRAGNIERFSLDLTLGNDWSSPNGRHIRRNASQLLPGESVVLKLPLRFHGTTAPSSMPYSMVLAKVVKPWILPIVLAAPLVWLFLRELRARRAVVIDDAPIDTAWVERNVLWHKPEVAGAFLHGDVGPPEVSALLARMEQEGKIRTRVETGSSGRPNLHLERLVPLGELHGAEHAIAQRIFRDKDATNTAELRKVYRKIGFDPPGVIRNSVIAAAIDIAPVAIEKMRFGRGIALVVFGIGVIVAAGIQQPASFLALFVLLFGGIFLALLGLPAATIWRKRRSTAALIRILGVPVLAVMMARFVQRFFVPNDAASGEFTLLATLGLAIGWLGLELIILAEAGGAVAPETAVIRETLRRAREHFHRELKKPKPAIEDRWTPWLIALGLDRSIASWWHAHGGDAVASSASYSSTPTPSSSPSSSTTSMESAASTFTAGGGGFGGAGASGSWGTAAMAFATPVSAPSTSSGGGGSSSSSSSSSGSSSSGSSSGGGGGGGW